MRNWSLLALSLTLLPLAVAPCSAQASRQEARKSETFHADEVRRKINENMLVMVSGPFGATYLQLANDISVAVSQTDNVRVLPVASAGSRTNIGDILYARGVDLGIVSVQVLNAMKDSGEWGPNIDRRISYIAPLAVDTFQVLTRAEYNGLADLKGKKLSFNAKGSGTSVFGPKVLKALGAEPAEEINVGPGDAVQLLRRGEIDGAVCSCPMPVPAFSAIKPGAGLKFLEVPYVAALERDYVPTNLTDADYPNLIAPNQKSHTIATSTVLITFNWPPGTERYKKIERFVDAFFSNIDKLMEPTRHPVWKQVNIGATIRGWQRFSAAQRWLDRQAAKSATKGESPAAVDTTQARAQAARAAPRDPAEQERLFREFLEWSRNRPKR
jgi:TRAP transporter TAXI family solute receptor